MIRAFQRVGWTIVLALVANATIESRQHPDAGVMAQFQRAADSYAFQHRQAERRGAALTPFVEGAFFTPQVASAFRDRIRRSGCKVPQAGGDSVVPRPNDSIEGTSPLAPCVAEVLPSLPAELEFRARGVALLLADAHLHIVVDVLHAAFPVRESQ